LLTLTGRLQKWDLGGIGRQRPRGLHSFVIPASGELRKAFVLEDGGDGGGARSLALFPQQIPNIVDREILFAQRDDSLPERIGLGGGVGSPLRCNEELRRWIVSEVMTKTRKLPGVYPKRWAASRKGALR